MRRSEEMRGVRASTRPEFAKACREALRLNNLAAKYHAEGNATRPEKLYRRAWEIQESVLGPDDAAVAVTLSNLAAFYRMVGRFRDARPLYERAISILETVHGAAHGDVAVVLFNYGELLKAEAAAVQARAKEIEKSLREMSDPRHAAKTVIDAGKARFQLVTGVSRIHRYGVFAAEEIPAGRLVIEYTGERVSRSEAVHRWNRRRTYLVKLDSYWRLDGSVGGSGAELLNHCCEPNTRLGVRQGRVWVISLRRILPGEELTLDYRFPKDSERIPCYCGAATCRGTLNAR
ncbi:MAG: tetratricopeptide repeat protein [Acidobacteria bacterium]|nr:tetratricopeptide repeat protein [Acidobacteriota bacterium]